MDRREFLQMGAALGAALAIPSAVDHFLPVPVQNGGVIKIYAGAWPSKPSMIDPGMMLTEITLEPFEWYKGVLMSRGEAPGENIASAIGTHFIMESPSGRHRSIGSLGTAGAQLNMANTAFVTGGLTTLDRVAFRFANEKDALVWKGQKADKVVEQYFTIPGFELSRLPS